MVGSHEGPASPPEGTRGSSGHRTLKQGVPEEVSSIMGLVHTLGFRRRTGLEGCRGTDWIIDGESGLFG